VPFGREKYLEWWEHYDWSQKEQQEDESIEREDWKNQHQIVLEVCSEDNYSSSEEQESCGEENCGSNGETEDESCGEEEYPDDEVGEEEESTKGNEVENETCGEEGSGKE
jgi:hypothetical protein